MKRSEQKMIVITQDNQIKTTDYHGYSTIQKAVGGTWMIYFEANINIPFAKHNVIPITLYCKAGTMDYDYQGPAQKNDLAAIIGGQPVRGNIAVCVTPDHKGDIRGFNTIGDDSEYSTAFSVLRQLQADFKESGNELQYDWDNEVDYEGPSLLQ